MPCLSEFRSNSCRSFLCSILPFRCIRVQDDWCDASGDANYNCLVRLPSCRSAEKMHREV